MPATVSCAACITNLQEGHFKATRKAFPVSTFQLQAFALAVQVKNDPLSHKLAKLFLFVAFDQVLHLFLSPQGFAAKDFCRISPKQKRGSLINTIYTPK